MAKNVGTVEIHVSYDQDHYHAELAEKDYAKCGLRVFGDSDTGFEHIYADGDSEYEVTREVIGVLTCLGINGRAKIVRR